MAFRSAIGSKSGRAIESIRRLEDVDRVRAILEDKPRDLLLFDLATQTGLGMKALLRLKAGDLWRLKVGQRLPLAGGQAGVAAGAVMTATIHQTLKRYLEEARPRAEDYLFKSRKGGRPLSLSSVSHLIKSWFEAADLKGLGGAISLRKTWALHFAGRSPAGEAVFEIAGQNSVLKPIKATTIQESVHRELFQAIVSGRIHPGERLITDKIARQMKVSRMPVREALHRLEAAGFISMHPKRGAVVNRLSKDDLNEIFEIRLNLETMAAAAAAIRVSQETLNALEAIHEEFVLATALSQVDDFLESNKRFHHTLYRDARMPTLQHLIDGLWARVSPYFHLLIREEFIPDNFRKTHQGMLEAMRRRDPEEVARWLRDDLMAGRELITSMFDNLRKG